MNVSLSSSITLAQQHLGRAISKQVQGAAVVVRGNGNSTNMNRISLALGVITSFTGSAAAAATTTTTKTLCAPPDKDDSIFEKISKAVTTATAAAGGNSTNLNASLDELASSLGTQLQGALDSGIPTQLSYGFVSGYCSGLALKKVGRAAAVVFGMGFVVLQTLQYSGYIQVDHGKMKKDMESMFDLDKDGELDKDDAKVAYSQVLKILQYNMPAGGGFGAGFLGGLRSG